MNMNQIRFRNFDVTPSPSSDWLLSLKNHKRQTDAMEVNITQKAHVLLRLPSNVSTTR